MFEFQSNNSQYRITPCLTIDSVFIGNSAIVEITEAGGIFRERNKVANIGQRPVVHYINEKFQAAFQALLNTLHLMLLPKAPLNLHP